MTYTLRIALGVLIGAVAILGGTFYLINNSKNQLPVEPQTAPVVIQVIKSGVFILDDNGKGTPIISGTSLKAGTTITTDTSGEAELEFPSGSVARVDHQTTLTLTDHFFDENSGTSETSLFLKLGRVWSRVAKLATPASSWEVKTSNIVAAVRGTAFNVGFTKDKKSRILVDKDSVSLKALNSDTKEVLGETIVQEKKFVELDAAKKILPAGKIEATAPPAGFVEDEWITKNQKQDEAIKEKIGKREIELQEKAAKFEKELDKHNEKLEFRIQEMKKNLREREDKEKQTSESVKEALEKNKAENPSDNLLNRTSPTDIQSNTLSGSGSLNTNVKTTTLHIKPVNKQSAYFEGTDVSFIATLELTDGTQTDITEKVQWSVKGPIGTIGSNGVLKTGITDVNAAEFGKADGSVNAAFNLSEGRVLNASEPVTIISPPPTDTGGNQG